MKISERIKLGCEFGARLNKLQSVFVRNLEEGLSSRCVTGDFRARVAGLLEFLRLLC